MNLSRRVLKSRSRLSLWMTVSRMFSRDAIEYDTDLPRHMATASSMRCHHNLATVSIISRDRWKQIRTRNDKILIALSFALRSILPTLHDFRPDCRTMHVFWWHIWKPKYQQDILYSPSYTATSPPKPTGLLGFSPCFGGTWGKIAIT